MDLKSILDARKRREVQMIHTNCTEFHVNLNHHDKVVKKKTVQHFKFKHLMRLATARHQGHHLNVLMIGEKGTGKSTAAEQIAKLLDRPFFFHSAVGDEFKLKGFKDAHGKFQDTQYYQAWQQPSVLLLDELDASDPNALLSVNTDLANMYADFPTGKFDKHPECLVLGGSNTNMKGATSDYTGRSTQDSALRDRFVKTEWPLDEEMELNICGYWAHWGLAVQEIRSFLKEEGEEFLSPRSSYFGSSIFENCKSEDTWEFARDLVIESTLMHDYDPSLIKNIMNRKEVRFHMEDLEEIYSE